MRNTLGIWLFALLCVSVITAAGLWVFPEVVPWSPNELARALLLKGVLISFVSFIGAAFLLFLNGITGPDWFETIGRNEYAVCVFASCIWLGIVLLAIFT